jgi:hypothetical protein
MVRKMNRFLAGTMVLVAIPTIPAIVYSIFYRVRDSVVGDTEPEGATEDFGEEVRDWRESLEGEEKERERREQALQFERDLLAKFDAIVADLSDPGVIEEYVEQEVAIQTQLAADIESAYDNLYKKLTEDIGPGNEIRLIGSLWDTREYALVGSGAVVRYDYA